MPESEAHKRLKRKAAGKKGQVEKRIARGKRLDALSRGGVATEVERGKTKEHILKALRKLKTQTNRKKTLQVYSSVLDKAKELAKKEGMNVTIWNLSKTRRRIVRKKSR